MSVRVVLADDHRAVRAGIRMILEDGGIEVVAEASDGRAAVHAARALRPDLVLMDIRMPGVDGIAATAEITAEKLAEVLVLTSFDIDEYVFGALRAGAVGFVLKSTSAVDLLEAVRRVAAGDGVLAPEVTRRMIEAFVTSAPSAAVASPLIDALTTREREVLACLGRGLSNAEIARELFVTATTAKTHVSRTLGKLECSSRMQAAIIARQAGLT